MTRLVEGQVAIEFMAIFMILLAALLIVSVVSYTQTLQVNQYRLDIEVDKVLNEVKFKVDTVYLEGLGFSINMTLPENINGIDYSIQIDHNQIILEIRNVTYTKQILPNNVTGDPKKGLNIIENRKGGIVIS